MRFWARITALVVALVAGGVLFTSHYALGTETYANKAQSTINHGGGYTSSDTSIVLTSSAAFPTTGTWRAVWESEFVEGTANNTGTNTVTIVRGQESTSAVSHANGTTFTQVITKAALDQIKLDATGGMTFPTGGSLTTGNLLGVTGSSTIAFAALNLAGGSGYVTGALPLANQSFCTSSIASTVDETTASTGYVQLGTTTDSCTATTGTTAFLCFYASTYNAAAAGNTAFVSIAVSGATTLAAADGNAVAAAAAKVSAEMPASRCLYLTGLTAGSNNFLMKYRVDGGTYHFTRRNVIVHY